MRPEHVFPTLTPVQIARIAAHGKVRRVEEGEVLFHEAQQAVPFFVVTAGRIEIVQPAGAGETTIAVHRPGEFTGETTMLTNRRSLVIAFVHQALKE